MKDPIDGLVNYWCDSLSVYWAAANLFQVIRDKTRKGEKTQLQPFLRRPSWSHVNGGLQSRAMAGNWLKRRRWDELTYADCLWIMCLSAGTGVVYSGKGCAWRHESFMWISRWWIMPEMRNQGYTILMQSRCRGSWYNFDPSLCIMCYIANGEVYVGLMRRWTNIYSNAGMCAGKLLDTSFLSLGLSGRLSPRNGGT